MDNFNHVLLFKTDIKNEGGKSLLHQLLNADARVCKWSIDMDDEDCVLRVVSETLTHQQIIDLINKHGYSCCELI